MKTVKKFNYMSPLKSREQIVAMANQESGHPRTNTIQELNTYASEYYQKFLDENHLTSRNLYQVGDAYTINGIVEIVDSGTGGQYRYRYRYIFYTGNSRSYAYIRTN